MNRGRTHNKFVMEECIPEEEMPADYRKERAWEVEMQRLAMDAAKMTEEAVMDLLVKLPFTTNQEQRDILRNSFRSPSVKAHLLTPYYQDLAESFGKAMKVVNTFPRTRPEAVSTEPNHFWNYLKSEIVDEWYTQFGEDFEKIGLAVLQWMFHAVYESCGSTAHHRLYRRKIDIVPCATVGEYKEFKLKPNKIFRGKVEGKFTCVKIIDDKNAEVRILINEPRGGRRVPELEWETYLLPYTYQNSIFKIEKICEFTVGGKYGEPQTKKGGWTCCARRMQIPFRLIRQQGF